MVAHGVLLLLLVVGGAEAQTALTNANILAAVDACVADTRLSHGLTRGTCADTRARGRPPPPAAGGA